MPLIEFVCHAGHRIEKLLTFAEAEHKEHLLCPECSAAGHSRTATRVISAPAVVFKGEGWTPTFHTPSSSQIGGVPVKQGDDPADVAKKVLAKHGGGKALTKAVKGAK